MKTWQKYLFWASVSPALILGWGQIGAAVYFIDWVEFARSIITEENLERYNQLLVKMDYVLEKLDLILDFIEREFGERL